MWMGTRLPFLQIPEGGREEATAAEDITKSTKTTDQKTRYFESKHDKGQTAMGSNGKQKWRDLMKSIISTVSRVQS